MVDIEEEYQESVAQSSRLPLVDITIVFKVLYKVFKRIFRRKL